MIRVSNDLVLNRKETIRYLGYGANEPDEIMLEEIAECEAEFLQAVDAKFHYVVFDLCQDSTGLSTADKSFYLPGKSINRHLAGCDKAAFCCVTLSGGVDELIDQAQEKDMLKALLYDAIANASIEAVRHEAEAAIGKEYSEYQTNFLFGIGYGDLPLDLQPKFLETIDAAHELGVTVSKHLLLNPLKSITGFVGLKRLNGCEKKAVSERSCLVCNLNATCSFKKVQTKVEI